MTTFSWNYALFFSGFGMQPFCVIVNSESKTERSNRKCSNCQWQANRHPCGICEGPDRAVWRQPGAHNVCSH